ncbi:MAG: hypothetical protein AAB519_02460 [Patescibacteria group bacterium]
MNKKEILQTLLLITELVLFGIYTSFVLNNYSNWSVLFDRAWGISWKIFATIGFGYFCFLFVRIITVESKLKKMYAKRNIDLSSVNEPVPMAVRDGRIRKIQLDYQGEISSLEKQRKQDLEKIPFLRK